MMTDPYPITSEPEVRFSDADREKLAEWPSHSGPNSPAIADLLTLIEIDARKHGVAVDNGYGLVHGYSPVQQRKRILDYVRELMKQRDKARKTLDAVIAAWEDATDLNGDVDFSAVGDVIDATRVPQEKADG